VLAVLTFFTLVLTAPSKVGPPIILPTDSPSPTDGGTR
jgi:hypothetical protein